jgi:hypothetical protein
VLSSVVRHAMCCWMRLPGVCGAVEPTKKKKTGKHKDASRPVGIGSYFGKGASAAALPNALR